VNESPIWYCDAANQQQGPVAEAELKSRFIQGLVTAETMVWRDGMAGWQPLKQVLPWGTTALSAPTAMGGAIAPVPTMNQNAVLSLVFGISSLLIMLTCLLGIIAAVPAVICGYSARREILNSPYPQDGAGLATAGIITGWVTIALTVIPVLFFLVLLLFAFFANAASI